MSDSSSPLAFKPRSRRGPRPKPTEQKRLEGNRGRRPLPQLEPQPGPLARQDDLPPAPEHLDALAARLWAQEFGPIVVQMKVMTQADWVALGILCAAESRRRVLEDDVQENGRYQTVTTTQGDRVERARPQVGELRNIGLQVVNMLREFGLTPSSRPKVQMVPMGQGHGGRGSGTGEGGNGGEGYFG